jgi:hypothetical protein
MGEYERETWKRLKALAKKKGIPIDPRWARFQNFLDDLGPCPEDHTLHRDPHRGYFKGQCRWTPRQDFLEGRGPYRLLAYDGVTQTVKEWSCETGIPIRNISQRLFRRWPVESVLGFAPPPSSNDRTYKTWRRILSSGKPVCPRWKGRYGYWNFLDDMGEKQKNQALTRHDLSKGFNPENCIYIEKGEWQEFHAKRYSHDGVSLSLQGWAKASGIPAYLLKSRLEKKGLSLKEALDLGPPPPPSGKGYSQTPTQVSYYNLKARLQQPTNRSYQHWGAKGYRLCARWQTCKNFIEDMGERPGKASVCIKPGRKVFNKENCYWGTQAELLSATNSRKVTYKGKTMTITQWAEYRGMTFATLYQRLCVLGWPKAEALGYKKPSKKREPPKAGPKGAGWGGLKVA